MKEISISIFELFKIIMISNVIVYIFTSNKYCVITKGYFHDMFGKLL
jgi:hypothetical protein